MFEYKKVDPESNPWKHEVVEVMCLTSGKVLKDNVDMEQHFTVEDCQGEHEYRKPDAKLN